MLLIVFMTNYDSNPIAMGNLFAINAVVLTMKKLESIRSR